MSALSLQPTRVPLVDPQTGLITPQWYRFFSDTFERVGGANSPTIPEVSTGVTNITNIVNEVSEEIGVAPLAPEPRAPDDDPAPRYEPAPWPDDVAPPVATYLPPDDVTPVAQLVAAVEFLQTEVRSLAEQLAVALTQIQELKQGTML